MSNFRTGTIADNINLVYIIWIYRGYCKTICNTLMSQSMQNYKRKPPAGLVQFSTFSFLKATMHCVVLYCLQGFPEFILGDTAYLLQIEFLFLLNHADV